MEFEFRGFSKCPPYFKKKFESFGNISARVMNQTRVARVGGEGPIQYAMAVG